MKTNKILLLLLLPVFGFSQFINDGGTITIQSGAILHVETDVHNQNSGTIDIQGTGSLQVAGDLTIDAGTTFTTSSTSEVRFIDGDDSQLTSNGAEISNLVMDKTSANLILMDDSKISESIDFNSASNKIIVGTNDITLASTASITNAGTGKYIQTDGTGKLVMEFSAVGSKDFEVGDVDDYSPITVNVITATIGATNPSVAINVEDAKHSNVDVGVTDFLTRNWKHTVTDMTAYTATATATYTDADITGTEADIKGASYDGTVWNDTNAGNNTAQNTVNVDLTETDNAVTGLKMANELLMNLKTYLQGPFAGGKMNDHLRSASLVPTTEPYTGLSYTHVGGGGEVIASTVLDDTGDDNNIVDWIFVELRDMSDNTNVLQTKCALIQKDGDIVDLDGTSALGITDPNGDGMFFITIRHRNHLGFMSNTALALSTTATAYNFTDGSIATNGTDALKNDGGTYKMWGGNVNGNTNVRYSGPANDNNTLLNTVLSGNKSMIIGSTYQRADLNMNGNVRYSGPANDNNTLLNTVLGGNKSNIITQQL